MSQTKCPKCEKEILPDAANCQDCKGAIQNLAAEADNSINPDNPAHIFGLMTFGVVILGVIFLLVKSCGA